MKCPSKTDSRISVFEGVECPGIVIKEKILEKFSDSSFHPSLH
jgi:hypothetical protein